MPLAREWLTVLAAPFGLGPAQAATWVVSIHHVQRFADWDALMDHIEGGGALLDGEAAQARGRELRGEVRAAWLVGFDAAVMAV